MKATKKSSKKGQPLRERQKDLTRSVILQSLSEILKEDGVHGFSVQSVADRAGISHRTVYRHFPSREALLEALTAELDTVIEDTRLSPISESIDQFQNLIYQAFKVFGEKKDILQPLLIASLATGFRPSSSIARDNVVRKIVNNVAPNLTPQEQKETAAIMRAIGSSNTWLILTTQMGLTSSEAAKAVFHVIGILHQDLLKREKEARKRKE